MSAAAVDEGGPGPAEFDYDRLEPIPVVFGYAVIALSVLFFQLISRIVIRAGSPKSVKEADSWKWRNLLVSWIHAVIVGVWDLSCFVIYPEMMTDLIAFHNIYIYSMVSFSIGYFVYDFIDLFVNKQALKMWELIPHHISVAGTFFFNVVHSRCLAFNVIALLAEVNSIFLHARKLLQLAGVPYDRPVYRANSAVNIFTFVSCRFLGLAWIVYGMTVWHARVSTIYLAILSATMFILWVTNAILFWRLLCSDVLRARRGKRRLSDDKLSGQKVNGLVGLPAKANGVPIPMNGLPSNGLSAHHDDAGNHLEPDRHRDCSTDTPVLRRTSVQYASNGDGAVVKNGFPRSH